MPSAENPAPRVVRRVAVAPTDLEVVLLRLRRDTPEQRLNWNLGDNGACDLDAAFVQAPPDPAAPGPAWVTNARLWDPTHLAVAPIAVWIRPGELGQCEIDARPGVLSQWWRNHTTEYLRLAKAALDELGEELLWYAAGLRRERRPF